MLVEKVHKGFFGDEFKEEKLFHDLSISFCVCILIILHHSFEKKKKSTLFLSGKNWNFFKKDK